MELQDLLEKTDYLEDMLLDDHLTDVSAVERELNAVRQIIDRYIEMLNEQHVANDT